jgi:hypothetical protein
MSIKSFITEKLVRAKMKNLPKAQQDMFIKLINENPELFKKIGDEVKALTKGGASEMANIMHNFFFEANAGIFVGLSEK